MLDHFDESDLLALIEGELGPEEAKALWRRISEDPHARGVIQAMRRDRELLQSLGEPPVPVDLLAELEPRLARPMLMAPTGEDLRRRHRRRRRRYGPIATAAGIGLMLFGGVYWAAVSGLLSSTGPEAADRFATATDPASASNDVSSGVGDAWLTPRPLVTKQSRGGPVPPPGSSIHHRGPLDVPFVGTVADAHDEDAPARFARSGRRPSPNESDDGKVRLLAADFAIVLRSADAEDAQRILQNVAQRFPNRSAVVRNFSFAEAQRLAEAWLLTAWADIGPGETEARFDAARSSRLDRKPQSLSDLKLVASRAKSQLAKREQRRPTETDHRSEQLYGPKALAPSFEQQLDFSRRGADYTIAIPASQLRAALAQMQIIEAQTTTLRMLRVDEASAEPQGWLDAFALVDYAQARDAAGRLVQQSPEAVILLPVIVQSK